VIWVTATAVLDVDVAARLIEQPLSHLQRAELIEGGAILRPVGPLFGAHDVIQRCDANSDAAEVGFRATGGEILELPPGSVTFGMSCNTSSGPASVIHVVNSARVNVSGWIIAGAAAIASASLNPSARMRSCWSALDTVNAAPMLTDELVDPGTNLGWSIETGSVAQDRHIVRCRWSTATHVRFQPLDIDLW